MLYFGAIPLKPKSNSTDIVFAGNRSCLVSIVPRSFEEGDHERGNAIDPTGVWVDRANPNPR
jgi:hypothetical protein